MLSTSRGSSNSMAVRFAFMRSWILLYSLKYIAAASNTKTGDSSGKMMKAGTANIPQIPALTIALATYCSGGMFTPAVCRSLCSWSFLYSFNRIFPAIHWERLCSHSSRLEVLFFCRFDRLDAAFDVRKKGTRSRSAAMQYAPVPARIPAIACNIPAPPIFYIEWGGYTGT